MCCTDVSASFLIFSIITYIAIFTLTLLNMLFSILTPGVKDTFIMKEYTDYSKTFTLPLLKNMKFGEKLSSKDDYGLTNPETKLICFTGYCGVGDEYTSAADCTTACFNSSKTCKADFWSSCDTMYCDSSNRRDPNNKCITHNIIDKWRNFQIKKDIINYEFIPITHIINKGQECPSGYSQCGKLNSKDYLCLDEDYGCPINKIIVDENSEPPIDFNYQTEKIGDKYIHFTKENKMGFMYLDLSVDSDARRNNTYKNIEVIDTDTLANLFKYNPYIYNGEYNIYSNSKKKVNAKDNAYLNQIKYQTVITLEQMKISQEDYIKRKNLYNSKKIKEMNENVDNYTGVLMGFGIASFSAFACIAIFFIPIYSSNDCGNGCSKECDCGLCQNITPMKRVLLFYLVCSPTVIFSIFAFFVTLSKKVTYSEYSSMDYIDEYKNLFKDNSYHYYDEDNEEYYYFDKSIFYNNAQFWVLLIIVIFLILYPLLICLTSLKREEGPSKEDISKTAKKNRNNINTSTELTSSYNTGYDSSYSNNYIQPQQPIYTPAQPIYPPPQQPVYQGEQPYYQQPQY